MAKSSRDRVVLWDFDGTLAYRPDLWSGCLLELLDEELPDHQVTLDDLRPHLRDGFPWHHHKLAAQLPRAGGATWISSPRQR